MKVKASLLLFLISISLQAQKLHLMDEATIQSFDTELSGESAKRNLEYLSRLHRMRGSDDYNEATAFIMEQIKRMFEAQWMRAAMKAEEEAGTYESRRQEELRSQTLSEDESGRMT